MNYQRRRSGMGFGWRNQPAADTSGSYTDARAAAAAVAPGGETNGDGNGEKGLATRSLAMAYVPYQQWQNITEMPQALTNGTIFYDLYMPFLGYPGAGGNR